MVRVDTLGAAGATALCRNASNEIATCSSILRYRDGVEPFTGGIDLVHRLRPIGFTWKRSGGADIGFAAEEVARLDPRLATFNDNGDVEGVQVRPTHRRAGECREGTRSATPGVAPQQGNAREAAGRARIVDCRRNTRSSEGLRPSPSRSAGSEACP
jgi:hypothetical protein